VYIHTKYFEFMLIAVCDCVRCAVCGVRCAVCSTLIHSVCAVCAAVCGNASGSVTTPPITFAAALQLLLCQGQLSAIRCRSRRYRGITCHNAFSSWPAVPLVHHCANREFRMAMSNRQSWSFRPDSPDVRIRKFRASSAG
jgi:hypothetical protein